MITIPFLSKKNVLTAMFFFSIPSSMYGSEQQATYQDLRSPLAKHPVPLTDLAHKTDDCEWTLIDDDSFVFVEVEKEHSPQQQSLNNTDTENTSGLQGSLVVIPDPANTEETPQQQLMDAVLQNNFLKAKAAIEAGAHVNYRGKNKETLLHKACHNGNIELVELLLQAGAKKDRRDKQGESAFYKACYKGHKEIAILLSKHGACLLSKEKVLRLPKEHHSFTRDLTSKRIALQQDLIDAIIQKNLSKAKAALADGARIDHRTKNNKTMLHVACDKGNTELTKLLLQAGAVVTPLHEICLTVTPNFESAKLLIEAGADIEKSHKTQETLLYTACSLRYKETAHFLSNHGALPLKEGKISKRPLGTMCNKIIAERTQLIKQSLSEQEFDDKIQLLIQSFAR